MRRIVSSDCLSTTVKNTAGKSHVFGFLRHGSGKRLAANEQHTERGNLPERLGATRSARRFNALVNALEEGALQIIHTPGVFLWDDTDDRVRVLSVDNQALGTVDPCYDSSGSSDFTDGD